MLKKLKQAFKKYVKYCQDKDVFAQGFLIFNGEVLFDSSITEDMKDNFDMTSPVNMMWAFDVPKREENKLYWMRQRVNEEYRKYIVATVKSWKEAKSKKKKNFYNVYGNFYNAFGLPFREVVITEYSLVDLMDDEDFSKR